MTTENPRVRTSDAERERVAQILRDAVGEGRLTLEEGDERLATLYTTKFRDELAPLIADLPAAEHAAGRPGPRSGPEKARTGGGPGWDPTDPTGSGTSHAAGGWGGWGGPGWGGPGGPGGPGWGGPGRRGGFRPLFGLMRLLVLVAVVVGAVSLLGNGLWFVIPIAFILLNAGRCVGSQIRHHARRG